MGNELSSGYKLTSVSQVSDNQLLEVLHASKYRDGTKKRLIEKIRKADAAVNAKMETYKKSGVSTAFSRSLSVRGIIANVSGYYFLSLKETKVASGKDWSDSLTLKPSDAETLDASPFFHAKKDVEMIGCNGGMCYNIIDRDGFIMGVVSIAWALPYAFGHFKYMMKVSRTENFLQECLDYCDSKERDDSKIVGDGTIEQEGRMREFISSKVFEDIEKEPYIMVWIKTDDMVREIFGSL